MKQKILKGQSWEVNGRNVEKGLEIPFGVIFIKKEGHVVVFELKVEISGNVGGETRDVFVYLKDYSTYVSNNKKSIVWGNEHKKSNIV